MTLPTIDRGSEPNPERIWRIWFMSGQRVEVMAETVADAKAGPWNPSFGAIVDVEDLGEAYQ